MVNVVGPANNPEFVVDSIRSFIRRPFTDDQADSQFRRPLDDHIAKIPVAGRPTDPNDAAMESVSEFLLATTFASHPANPNRPELKERLNAGYTDDAFVRDSVTFTYSQLQNELEHIVTTSRDIAIKGKRGSGKTVLVNKWLNERTVHFFENDLRAFWARIDVTKLYDLHSGPITYTLVKEYFEVHAAYVFLEYSGALGPDITSSHHLYSPLFERILGLIYAKNKPESNSSSQSKKHRSRPGGESTRTFKASLSSIRSLYEHVLSRIHSKDFPSETIIAKALESTNFKASYLHIFGEIMSVCKSEGISLVGIVDGIDNIAWSVVDSKYVEACRAIQEFLERFRENYDSASPRTIVVAREETLPELVRKYTGTINGKKTREIVEFVHFSMPSTDPEKIIFKKLNAAKTNPIFEYERAKCMNKLVDLFGAAEASDKYYTILKIYDQENTSMLNVLTGEINKILGHGNSDKNTRTDLIMKRLSRDQFMPTVFNDNVRALLECFRLSREGRNRAVRMDIAGANRPERVPQYFMLAGKQALDSTPRSIGETRANRAETEQIFPNIFWYNTKEAVGHESKWHGLAGLRLLQLCQDRNTLSINRVISILVGLFQYSPTVLAEHVEAFVSYGLLRISYSENRWNLEKEAEKEDIRRASDEANTVGRRYVGDVETTEKGRLAASLALWYFDWLYFASLDTPIHRWFQLDRGTKYIRIYHAIEREVGIAGDRDHFFDAIVPTLATFLRHIYQRHIKELERVKNPQLVTKFVGDLYERSDLVWKIFDLPTNWLDVMCSEMLHTLEKRRERSAQMYNILAVEVLGFANDVN